MQAKQNKNAYSLTCNINGSEEVIRFTPHRLSSERKTYDIEQEYGLDAEGRVSTDYVPFSSDSAEAIIMETIRTGDVNLLSDAGIIFCERPKKGNISRNLALFDPKTGMSYTIGALGLFTPDPDDHTHFILKDPLDEYLYRRYQERRNNPVGGTVFFNEEGKQTVVNASKVGTIAYNHGPYHAVRKVLENQKLQDLGLKTPTFIAAGPIKNVGNGKFGYTLYRSRLTPEYLLNVSMYLDERGGFKNNYQIFLQSKYSQLKKLHFEIGETHGQPTNTNTLAEIDIFKTENNLHCQVKDFETNTPIPKSTDQIIEDGISPIYVGYECTKSPHAAALIYDMQHAIMQELNVLYLPSVSIKDAQQKFNYIVNQSASLLNHIASIYGIADPDQTKRAIDFAVKQFFDLVKSGKVGLEAYNSILGGCFVHAWFANSAGYRDQIKIVKQ